MFEFVGGSPAIVSSSNKYSTSKLSRYRFNNSKSEKWRLNRSEEISSCSATVFLIFVSGIQATNVKRTKVAQIVPIDLGILRLVYIDQRQMQVL